jgi:hypothetical protein
MIYCVDGCIGRKHQEKGRLVIMNFRGATFCLLMSLLFSCVFVVCKLWNLVCHEMQVPKSKVGGGVLLP